MKENRHLNIFFSYSHRDRRWVDQLRIFLKPYGRTVHVWTDSEIAPGESWNSQIQEAIAQCDLAVLFVSPDYLASDFITETELPLLFNRVDLGTIRLLALMISPTLLADSLSHIEFANPPDRPLDSLRPSRRNALFVQIAKTIAEHSFEREILADETQGRKSEEIKESS
jgi:internalin A